jgi:hypothetical protein
MIRQLIVHMCAELETDLTGQQPGQAAAESSWHRLGGHLITAICGLVAFFDGRGPERPEQSSP